MRSNLEAAESPTPAASAVEAAPQPPPPAAPSAAATARPVVAATVGEKSGPGAEATPDLWGLQPPRTPGSLLGLSLRSAASQTRDDAGGLGGVTQGLGRRGPQKRAGGLSVAPKGSELAQGCWSRAKGRRLRGKGEARILSRARGRHTMRHLGCDRFAIQKHTAENGCCL